MKQPFFRRLRHTGGYARIRAFDRISVQADPQFLEACATSARPADSLRRRQDAEAFRTRHGDTSARAFHHDARWMGQREQPDGRANGELDGKPNP